MIDNQINNPKSIKFHVKEFLEGIKSELVGKTVIDMPAGSSSTSEVNSHSALNAQKLFGRGKKLACI